MKHRIAKIFFLLVVVHFVATQVVCAASGSPGRTGGSSDPSVDAHSFQQFASFGGDSLTRERSRPCDGLMGERAKHVYNYNNGLWVETDSAPTNIYNLDGHPVYETDGESESWNVFAPDGLVARKQNGSWIYYQFDQQGNVAQRLNSSGTVLNSSSYDAYGNQALNGSTQNDPWAYNAQWGYVRDADTGLYYCQNRWYDPATGRWLNRDSIGYAGGGKSVWLLRGGADWLCCP